MQWNSLDKLVEECAFSGVVRVRRHGQTIYERVAGFADRANSIANTAETRFGIASGTKLLTALTVGRLIDAGRLALTTQVRDCVSVELPDYTAAITIQHLLTHTSGIPDYYDEELIEDFDNFTVGIPWYELRGPKDYLPVFPQREMKFAPGEGFSYCNSGYILLGVVIEEVTGKRFQDAVAEEVLGPARMDRSGFFAMNQLPECTALGYIEDGESWRTNIYNLPIVGASDGGLFSTLADIAALWDGFWNGEIVSEELVRTFSAPFANVSGDSGLHYGHGMWMRRRADGTLQHYIMGADPGISFKSAVDRQRQLDYAVISNTSEGAWPIARAIDDVLGKEE